MSAPGAGDAGTGTGLALVTGAAGALGRSVVARFLKAGTGVLAVDHDEALLTRLRAELAAPAGLAARRADLADSADVERLFGEAGRLSAVVHLVGGFRFARSAELSDRDWSYLVSLNLETTFRVFRAAARAAERAAGEPLAVVAVAAPAALLGEAGVGGYAAAKAGVLRMVESLAREIAPFEGRANAVLPGTMDTPANRAAMPDADPARWVRPEAVAEVIHFLTTPAAAAVNGAAVRVPGPKP